MGSENLKGHVVLDETHHTRLLFSAVFACMEEDPRNAQFSERAEEAELKYTRTNTHTHVEKPAWRGFAMAVAAADAA